ncbi:MAG: ATP-binding cassette domain-containing protein [Eggerthellaceae bacterium]|nr:ATP-binding cassette domain-containing protein [Eggerthellaceae bacterium]
MIQIEHLNKTYVSRQGEKHIALTDINLTIEDGSVFGIIGQSGAGKSTLVRCLNLLERPTSGSIIINGRDITSLSEKELREFRSSVSMVFQNFSLLQQRTVLRNVMFPLELRHADKKEAEKRARELLELVGLADKCDKYPSQLSGGQQQRVAIARALVNNPSIMLCDEATSALDSMTTHSILKLLKDINEKMGVTIVLITHSLAVAELICDNVVVIDEGKIVEEGKTEDIFANPQSDVARKLLEKRL